ncbi:MAG: hypothetical protein H6556_29165 [Lewinellaceae bacterium]|nr:hypothetical protein [Lewinellaceae bacterium]
MKIGAEWALGTLPPASKYAPSYSRGISRYLMLPLLRRTRQQAVLWEVEGAEAGIGFL